jgi:hypothetical protein
VLIRFLAAPEGARGDLYRALRDGVAFPFVSIRPADAGPYDVVHEDGDPDGTGGVRLIEPFEVPDGAGEEFLACWREARALLAAQRGYLGTRLYGGSADFRFVNVVRWSSPLMFARAPRPAMPFTSHPALYQPVTPS